MGIAASLFGEQINIPRIEEMPAMPQPFSMRNWKQVALSYDSLVFNLSASGQYLPLIWTDDNAVNYPEHERFGLHTVVGTPYPLNAEAINVLPAVIGASLCGKDKSDQDGYNYVLMCEEFFNNRPEENIYLNNFIGNSGNDWWYDTMPNVFFYQLAYLYPGTGHFDEQFVIVADRWLEAVEAMGGGTTPWQIPYMGYRGWHFSTMTPNASGVAEPEAAGAIAWILFHAFLQTGNPSYRIGAEWSMEYLNNLDSNPAYELQLPYGVYIAAKMNALLNTRYDIYKLLNWCFTTDGNVRQWGATLGNWGGYDCDGLIGEALYDGYAFAMNGFEQAAALVPLVRYDDRFARAIGKWVLNLANASRLFYTAFLPDENQDSEEWAHQYDPNSVIAHEALREFAPFSGISPYATGDAISGGWGATNLALYGSSHAGYLGAITDTTNVPGILLLNCLATDFYTPEAYPTYLCYNPYDSARVFTLNVGNEICDIYDAVSNQFILTAASGEAEISVPGDEALLIVLTPVGGEITYQYNRMLVNNIVADYNSGLDISNYPPRIKCLNADTNPVLIGNNAILYCTAEDPDNDVLSYFWVTPQGDTTSSSSSQYNYTAPYFPGNYLFHCLVRDSNGGSVSDSLLINVVESINHPPRILALQADPGVIPPEGSATIFCQASDPDNNPITFTWQASSGMLEPQGSSVLWTAPAEEGDYFVLCTVRDNAGLEVEDSVVVFVRNISDSLLGSPVLYLPFSGNTNDASGNNHDGIVVGAIPTADRLGNPDNAYQFDGIDDMIYVRNDSALNFKNGITLSFWMNIGEFYNREQYPLSHGNWENRWKVSLTPEKHIRWTIRTGKGIKDLDSQTTFSLHEDRMITCRYNGNDFAIFVDGIEDAASTFQGQMLTTNFDLTIGQVLPGVSGYNFNGVLDEILIYDYPLSDAEIQALFLATTSLDKKDGSHNPGDFILIRNFPNPFNTETTFRYYLPAVGDVSLIIYALDGKEVAVISRENQPAGWHSVKWEAAGQSTGIYLYRVTSGGVEKSGKCVLLK